MAKYGEESSAFTYDVFLSFRGEDTRDNFIGHLRKELRQMGINAFFDDNNLRIGEGISPALSKAIEESKVSIIVFSQNYASSTWCLNELVKILECTKRNNKQLAFPIFYHVDPSDVRHQRNCYGEALIAHQTRFGKDYDNTKAWKSALSEAANLKGHHIYTGPEIVHIEEIVKKVYANIAPKPLYVDEDPVGLEHRTEEVKSLLNMKPNDDTVCMLGIYGLGGIGKTELAKALYNNIVHQFQAASFLENVREKSDKNKGLEELQKTLLSEMLKERETNQLGSTSRGIQEIKCKLSKKKVLLVLDDVDDRKQLQNLAGGCDWFGSGSRIIITTRNNDLLNGHKVQKTYKMTELNDQHSLQLFCQHAFRMSHPETGYEDMSSRAVGYAKGLPLALKVIGSNLATKQSLQAWESALKSYERIPSKGIQDVLEVSYDTLELEAQTVFLDIACFFKGEKIEYVEEILEEYSATFNIEELVNKSLMTVECGRLKMHDLIQDMGREIVRKEAPRILGKRSRLWFYKDVIQVLEQDGGSDAIEGIILDPPQRELVDLSGTAFEKMKRLRILIVRNTSFSPEPKHLPNHLRLLDWEGYPSNSFPSKFHPKEIIVLNLTGSLHRMEESFKKFSCLTSMNFSYSPYITVMPDVSEVEKLRELRLDNCKSLITVHESVGFLQHLVHLSASGCTELTNFLQRMSLPSLKFLDLNLCTNLKHFPEIVDNMNEPLKICMINTGMEQLPDSIGNLTGLVSIELQSCWKLKYLPSSLFMLPNVVAFKIGGNPQLGESFRRFLQSPSAAIGRPALKTLYFGNGGLSDEDLHVILRCYPKLEELIASENHFVSLPTCIEESVHLTSLDVSGCQQLKKIPECNNLKILNIYQCETLEHISELPTTTQKVDARYCFSLARETSAMLWYQVRKEIRGLEIVMPQTEIPEWFDKRGDRGNPHFWVARGKKFPMVAVALVFQGLNGSEEEFVRRKLVELHLVINGQCIPRRGYYTFNMEEDHVLVCDLRLLFSDKEWLGLDAYLEHEWNLVQVSCEAPSSVTLSCWGVYVYKQGANYNMEDVQFMCPNPKYSYITATVPTTTRDPKQEQRKTVEELALDQMFAGMLREARDIPEEEYTRMGMADQMRIVKHLSEEAKDVLEGKALDDKKSKLAWVLRVMKGDYDEKDVHVIYDASKQPPDEASTSGHQGSSEVQGSSDPQQQEIMTEIFLEGMGAGLHEAKNRFPSLEIDATMAAALNKGNRVRWSFPEIQVENNLEMKIYTEGMMNGLMEAKLNFPTLDVVSTLRAVLSRDANGGPLMEIFMRGMLEGLVEAQIRFPSLDIKTTMIAAGSKGNQVMWSQQESGVENQVEMKVYTEGIIIGLLEARLNFPTLDLEATLDTVLSKRGLKVIVDWAKVMVPSSDDPLLQAFMMMKQPSCESEAKSKLYWELREEHKALCKKLEELENETATPHKDSCLLPSVKNQYDELIQKLNTRTALSSTEMHTDIGKEGCKRATVYEKLAAVLKGRAEELGRLYDAGIEGFQKSEEFQDLMNAIYLNGLRDGLHEAQAILLALDMDRINPVFEENEEHVTHEASNDENVTAEAADDENSDEAIGVADIPSPIGPEVANPQDTSNLTGSELMEEFGHIFY